MKTNPTINWVRENVERRKMTKIAKRRLVQTQLRYEKSSNVLLNLDWKPLKPQKGQEVAFIGIGE